MHTVEVFFWMVWFGICRLAHLFQVESVKATSIWNESTEVLCRK